MNRLQVEFLGLNMKNPVVVASGTYGFGNEYGEYYDINQLGGICTKGLTLKPKEGNDGIRLWETPSGMINSIGLENPGMTDFCENYLDEINKRDTLNIVNVGGSTINDYIESIEKLNEHELDIIELNISCPNVKAGGMAFGIKANDAAKITETIKSISKHPIMVKLSPNAENIVDVAKACEDSGADTLSLVNTFQAMAIDIKNRKAVFNNTYAGLSGPAIKPIALRMVHQVSKAVNIPIMGLGGIMTWEDSLEFIMAGATCVQVGTANFVDPHTPINIIKGLEDYCDKENIDCIGSLIGIV